MFRFVPSVISIYLLVTMNVPKWVIKATDTIRRAFLWKKKLMVGTAWRAWCLGAWEKVNRPIDFGGLGILNLNIMGWTLHMIWLWLRKTSVTRPWMGLDIPIQPHVRAIFAISVISLVGNGEKESVFV